MYNAAQFELTPRQSRNRIIGGRYPEPEAFRPLRREYGPDVCPTVTATEYKGCASDTRRASRFYGRRLTVSECAYHQGLGIPSEWLRTPTGWTRSGWLRVLYETIGNGVPVYMARAFGIVAR